MNVCGFWNKLLYVTDGCISGKTEYISLTLHLHILLYELLLSDQIVKHGHVRNTVMLCGATIIFIYYYYKPADY